MENKITLEVVGHYPKIYTQMITPGQFKAVSEDPNCGDFHIYWIEKKMDIRGCMYHLKSPSLTIIRLPELKRFDKDSGRYITFTTFAWTDEAFHKQFFDEVKRVFLEYAKEKYLSFNEKYRRPLSKKRNFMSKRKINKSADISTSGTSKRFRDFQDYKSKIFKAE